jgi:lambda family phage portal protein
MNTETFFGGNIIQKQAYEGATHKYHDSLRSLVKGEADTLAARELAFLQMRSSHAIRNNGYAKSALDKYVTNMQDVQVKWIDSKGKQNKQMQSLWDEFAKNPALDGYGNFSTLFAILHASMFETGNSLGRLHIRRTNNNNKIPLKIQLIDTQLLATGFMGTGGNISTTNLVRNGIEFSDGKPLNYFFLKSYTERKLVEQDFNIITVPAEEVLHTFIRTSPGQWLGIPFLASVLINLYELDELTDATIARQKASQIVSWIVERSKPMALTAIGVPEKVTTKDESTNETIEETLLRTSGTNVIYTNSNEKVTQAQSADIGNGLDTLIQTELKRVSASLGIPFHSLTGDTSGLNFSSIRAINVELRTRIELIIRYYIIPLYLEKITNKFFELAKLYSSKIGNVKPFYQLPRNYGTDDLKDAQADLLEVQSGFATLQSKLDERHISFEELIADRERVKEAGLEHLLSTESQASQSTNIKPNDNSTGS